MSNAFLGSHQYTAKEDHDKQKADSEAGVFGGRDGDLGIAIDRRPDH
jgi:hypothetical protein